MYIHLAHSALFNNPRSANATKCSLAVPYNPVLGILSSHEVLPEASAAAYMSKCLKNVFEEAFCITQVCINLQRTPI